MNQNLNKVGKLSRKKYILGTSYNKMGNIYFIVFPGKLSYPSYFRNNFHIWHYLRNSFQTYRNKKLKNVLKSAMRGDNKQNKIQTRYKNQVT